MNISRAFYSEFRHDHRYNCIISLRTICLTYQVYYWLLINKEKYCIEIRTCTTYYMQLLNSLRIRSADISIQNVPKNIKNSIIQGIHGHIMYSYYQYSLSFHVILTRNITFRYLYRDNIRRGTLTMTKCVRHANPGGWIPRETFGTTGGYGRTM